MRTRALAALAAFAAVASFTAACGAGSSSPSSGGSVTLHVLSWKGSGNEQADMPQLNAAFEAQHPDIRIDFKVVDRNDYENYNNPRLAAGDAADVMMLDKTLMNKWQSQGYLADLSDQPWVGTMDPSLKSFNSVGGKTYQFNQENIGLGLYANLDLLKQAGIAQAPGDWPTFVADLRALKAHGTNGLMVGDKGGWGGDNLLQGLAANLVYPNHPTWSQDYDQGRVHFDPDWRQPVQDMSQLLSSGLVNGQLMQGIDSWSDALNQFKSGSWAFLVQGAWELSDFTTNIKFHFALAPIPGNATGTPPQVFTFVGTGLGMNSQTKHADAAKAYIAFMATPQNAQQYLKAEGAFTTQTGGTSPLPDQAQPLLAAYQAGHRVAGPAESLGFTDAETQIQTAAQSLFADPGTDVGKLLGSLEKAIPPTPAAK